MEAPQVVASAVFPAVARVLRVGFREEYLVEFFPAVPRLDCPVESLDHRYSLICLRLLIEPSSPVSKTPIFI